MPARIHGSSFRFGWRLGVVLRVVAACLGTAAAASGQDQEPRPIVALDGRFTLRGDATATLGPDDTGYFDYTDYDHGTQRLVRFDLTAALRASDQVSFLVEARAEGDSLDGLWRRGLYAAFVRVRPWASRPFDVSAGRVPTAFGAFPRRVYATDNPLIGYPLAFQYITSLRSDAVPANADELATMRGRGWLVGYSVGDKGLASGLPVVSVSRYDTGVLVHGGTRESRVEGLVSITAGTLSYPALDGNGSPQVAGRVVVRPVVGLALGGSLARGEFVEGNVDQALPPERRQGTYDQRAWGADAEYSRDYWLLRAEVVHSAWRLPALGVPVLDRPLTATAWYVEGRYKIVPGLYAAARYDRISFGDIRTGMGMEPWEARVSRVEAGIGYSLARWLLVKATVQDNHRDGGRVTHATIPAIQAVLWF